VTELVVVVVAGTGIAVAASGVPIFRNDHLRRRVEPYLAGLHGRPSLLLARPRSGSRPARWLEERWPAVMRPLSDRLEAAGVDATPGEFRIEQIGWGLLAASTLVGLSIMGVSGGIAVDLRGLPLLAVTAFVAGFLARDWWLTRQTAARRAVTAEELPVALDLITLAIMSGESIPAAFARVADVLGGGMGGELRRTVADVRAGAPLVDALEAMKNRLPDYSVVRFVDAVCTGIERGAPLADVLRNQADDAREARRRTLLEMGGRREILMLLPVVFLILPVVVAIALLPGLVSLDLLVP
jgi:tight adherence protein C